MAEELKEVITEQEVPVVDEKKVSDEEITKTVERINELQKLRKEVARFNDELEIHQKDLTDAETLYGKTSDKYHLQEEHVSATLSKIESLDKQISSLSYKRSELKDILDTLTKNFEDAYRSETAKDYHIEIASDAAKAKKVFKQLLEYLYHNVSFTPKTAANLMVLVRNMEENKAWVNSKDFDSVILLRSASVLSLWRFIIEDMSGKGFYEARTFLECWANCGQAVSDAVREIKKDSAVSREIGANLNLVEEEFERSENDLPDTDKPTTSEEVNPDVEA